MSARDARTVAAEREAVRDVCEMRGWDDEFHCLTHDVRFPRTGPFAASCTDTTWLTPERYRAMLERIGAPPTPRSPLCSGCPPLAEFARPGCSVCERLAAGVLNPNPAAAPVSEAAPTPRGHCRKCGKVDHAIHGHICTPFVPTTPLAPAGEPTADEWAMSPDEQVTALRARVASLTETLTRIAALQGRNQHISTEDALTDAIWLAETALEPSPESPV